MRKFLPEFFTAQLTCASSFGGTFRLAFDQATEYTHKSQYLTRVNLLGSKPSGLEGNEQDNQLRGNRGDNVIQGGVGIDTVSFRGLRAEYLIECGPSGYAVEDTVPGRDGRDSISTVEFLGFSDLTVPAVTLYADPTDPSTGDTLTLGICNGVAQRPVAYAAVEVGGTPVLFWLLFSALDAQGEHSFSGTVVPGLSGLTLRFRAFTFDGHGAVVPTNDATTTVQ